ncbi:hypothetical protein BC938DRAFT_483263 [Jimgerdemannia flammicorona]|uniref:Copper acquisition factor BIM1-like domain-containing protein n=1 Tax=Jimgerdemannia flammicorona TaxID=994334 RepID=A0A433QCG5_9FUNG|nr:hypothetical protein BC938DRAFT_483263 [Jimgerdemannia flammicorona]
MQRAILLFVLLALLASSVSAHFILTYPVSRGFDDDMEPTSPCGSFNTLQNRTLFPISSGFVEINSGHVKATLQINIIFSSNPQTTDFSAAANSSASVKTNVDHPGFSCVPFDLSANSLAKNGTNATIQAVFNSGEESTLYQCTDVILSTSASNWNSSACINAGNSSGNSTTPSKSDAAALMQHGFVAILVVVALAINL